MRTAVKDGDAQIAAVRLSEGISLIFDQETLSSSASSPSPTRSRSRSSHRSSNHSSGPVRRAHKSEIRKDRHRSSSSPSSTSSLSSSGSRPRSRSHPRCHRASSRSRCCHRHRHGHSLRSPARSPDRSSSRRSSHRSRPRSSAGRRADGRAAQGGDRHKSSRATKSYRSRSRSPGRSAVKPSLNAKNDNLRTATDKPQAEERARKSAAEQLVTPEPVLQRSPTQNTDLESEDEDASPRMSPKRKVISFSINNSIAKPTVKASSSAESKFVPRVEIYTSRRPYGHWVPVKTTTKTLASRPSKHSLSSAH